MATLAEKRAHIGLSRLARFASANAIDPGEIDDTAVERFIAAVRESVPPGARILGLHTYWFGLQDFDYRSFLVPLNWADEGLPLDQGLARVAPDIVLVDARMRDYFYSNSPDVVADRDRFYGWLEQHGGTVIGRVDDPTYGLMEVYRVQR